ncbi:MAG: ECF transporter S component [Nanoarchaeota archaeon]
MLELLLKKKKKKKLKQELEVDEELDVKQRLAQQSVQKQLQVLDLRGWLITIGFILGAAALRVPMQTIPSAEPITFFALLGGWLFGKRKGFLIGAGALYASNFLVFGGQGLWTIFQAIGFGLAGFLGSFLTKKAKIWQTVTITLAATVIFEIVVNIGSILTFPMPMIPLLMGAIPFAIIHLTSNTAFALLLPKTKEFIYKKGEFDQREICNKLLDKFNQLKQMRVKKK